MRLKDQKQNKCQKREMSDDKQPYTFKRAQKDGGQKRGRESEKEEGTKHCQNPTIKPTAGACDLQAVTCVQTIPRVPDTLVLRPMPSHFYLSPLCQRCKTIPYQQEDIGPRRGLKSFIDALHPALWGALTLGSSSRQMCQGASTFAYQVLQLPRQYGH